MTTLSDRTVGQIVSLEGSIPSMRAPGGFAILVLILVVSCRSARRTDHLGGEIGSPNRAREDVVEPPRDAGGERLADASRTTVPVDSGITSPCVLHAAEITTHRHEIFNAKNDIVDSSTETSCSFNAECLRRQGVASPGDGNVDLDCVNRQCTCMLRRLSAPKKPTKFSFRVDPACATSEMAQKLIEERCMVGLNVIRR